MHDKDSNSFKETVEIGYRYQHTSKKDHIKLEASGTKQSQFTWKCKTPKEFLDHDFKRQNPFGMFCKKKGHTKEQCQKLQHEHDNKNKVTDHKDQIPNVLEIYIDHCSCKCSLPHYALGPNDLLRANGYINGS